MSKFYKIKKVEELLKISNITLQERRYRQLGKWTFFVIFDSLYIENFFLKYLTKEIEKSIIWKKLKLRNALVA